MKPRRYYAVQVLIAGTWCSLSRPHSRKVAEEQFAAQLEAFKWWTTELRILEVHYNQAPDPKKPRLFGTVVRGPLRVDARVAIRAQAEQETAALS